MAKTKIVNVKFNNYWKTYAFKTKLNLIPGQKYMIVADGAKYSTPVVVEKYSNVAPVGIDLKEIEEAFVDTEKG